MTEQQSTSIGILHPGAMGISIATSIQQGGYEVCWASDGRSIGTIARAEKHHLTDVGTLADLCARCSILICVCPPHATEEVAEAVIATGFRGHYVDANAISPQKVKRIGEKMQAAGIQFTDGSIVGPPAWEAKRTWVYLSGEDTNAIAALFDAGLAEVDVIGTEIGKASALKMCFAANTKGTTALLSAILALAEGLGVRAELERQWTRYDEKSAEQNRLRAQRVTAKAWRFSGEMDEIAATFAEAGLPDGFHQAAGTIYQRMAHFKDADELPDLLEVLSALLEGE